MAGDVGDQEANAVLVYRQIFVKVAGHLGHGLVHRGDAEIAEVGSRRGQDGKLQLASNGEFALNRQQAALVGEDDLQGDVA